MKAGKPLDVLVAQHVFGWTIENGKWLDPDSKEEVPRRPFSTDISQAFEVADQIFNIERGFRLGLDGSKLWQARFYKSVAHTLETRAMAATSGNPAEAICLAALAVRGVERPGER
jgi:hypothetical protein